MARVSQIKRHQGIRSGALASFSVVSFITHPVLLTLPHYLNHLSLALIPFVKFVSCYSSDKAHAGVGVYSCTFRIVPMARDGAVLIRPPRTVCAYGSRRAKRTCRNDIFTAGSAPANCSL